jgi:imidazolonepropionase-like amidohydrolase
MSGDEEQSTNMLLGTSCNRVSAVVLLFAIAPLSLAAAPAQSAGVTALTHIRVIDGTGRTPAEDATILIEGNRIKAIQSAAASVPAGARVLDLHGDTVIPGLINAHGHLALVVNGQNSATGYTQENVVAELRQYES